MGDLRGIESIKALSGIIDALTADSLEITRPWKRRGERAGGPHALTNALIAPGSWLLFGQATFQINGGSDTWLEIELRLSITDADQRPYTRTAYQRIQGLGFGSPVVIGAFHVQELATVELVYSTQGLNATATPTSPIITAVKTSNLRKVA